MRFTRLTPYQEEMHSTWECEARHFARTESLSMEQSELMLQVLTSECRYRLNVEYFDDSKKEGEKFIASADYDFLGCPHSRQESSDRRLCDVGMLLRDIPIIMDFANYPVWKRMQFVNGGHEWKPDEYVKTYGKCISLAHHNNTGHQSRTGPRTGMLAGETPVTRADWYIHTPFTKEENFQAFKWALSLLRQYPIKSIHENPHNIYHPKGESK